MDRDGSYTITTDVPAGGVDLTIKLTVKTSVTLTSSGVEKDNKASFTYDGTLYSSVDRVKIKPGISINKYVSSKSSGSVSSRSGFSESEKEADPVEVGPTNTVTYTIVVTNVSKHAISNLTITDTFASGLTYSSGDWTASSTARTYTKSVNVPAKSGDTNGSVSVTITLSVDESITIGSAYRNRASITKYGVTKNSDDWVKVDPGITIKKYITIAGSETFSRSSMTMSQKASNPIYVRRGTEVTYQIVISVEIPCKLSFTDTYDSNFNWVSSTVLDNTTHAGSYNFTSANESYSFTVTLKLSEDVPSSSTTNRANRISINNSSIYDEDYIRCEYIITVVEDYDDYSPTVTVYKYITETTENNSVSDRSNDTNDTKAIYPETIVSGDTVTYEVRVENNSSEIVGTEYNLELEGVSINYITLNDNPQTGLEASSSQLTFTNIAAGTSQTQTVTCTVTESDMYLLTLYNEVTFDSGEFGMVVIDQYTEVWKESYTDSNGSIVNTQKTDIWYESRIVDTAMDGDMVDDSTYNRDYVQLDDVEIAGDVWLDSNGDGIWDDDESAYTDINIYLYKNGSYFATTTIDESGHYTFKKQEKGNTAFGSGTRKYADNSGYNTYYVVFEYFGVYYQSTIYTDGSGVR